MHIHKTLTPDRVRFVIEDDDNNALVEGIAAKGTIRVKRDGLEIYAAHYEGDPHEALRLITPELFRLCQQRKDATHDQPKEAHP